MTFGICKLTGARGTFVRCHLLPKALTSPPNKSEVRVEAGEGRLPVRRYDGWFDKTIVTRKGEDIFEQLDTFAISELRRLKLVWSSWADNEQICPIESKLFDDDRRGFRQVSFSNPEKMRLFCLSLLWRAATTNVIGFSTVVLSPERLQILTDMLLTNTAKPYDKFPVHLIQLSTRGGWHNQTPLKQSPQVTDENGIEQELFFFRFYFDGLVIHINDEISEPVNWRSKGVALGETSSQIVLTVPFEHSFQNELINDHMLGT